MPETSATQPASYQPQSAIPTRPGVPAPLANHHTLQWAILLVILAALIGGTVWYRRSKKTNL